MHCGFVGLIALTLGGCAFERAQQAQSAKRQLVGMSGEQIIACMGPPNSRSALGGTEVWQYRSGNGHTDVDSGVSATSVGGFRAASVSSTATQRFCIINVVMSGLTVRAVNYSGPTGGVLTDGEQCAFALKNCLPAKN